MKVVASMQAKRGSSRGLVHYIAHSKLNTEREPQNSRELFNAFSDHLSVKSANNSMRVGLAKGRPSNDELHHLVLSFRSDDYRKLGADEAGRRQALKAITREVMKSLESSINARRLLWTAAVHRNTENPHVHIAIQKHYLSKEIERQTLTKIPRETLPHYEFRDEEKVLVQGVLIEAATEKMEAIIERERSRNGAPKREERQAVLKNQFGRKTEPEPTQKSPDRTASERNALAKGILAEYELLRIDTRIDSLLDHGAEMRFLVNDPASGKKKRISLRNIRGQDVRNETYQPTAAERQIRTILHKMLAKEEAVKSQLQNDLSDVIRETKRVRGEYRKSGRQLPVPSLKKEELDKLQGQCLEQSDLRRFSYLERIRTELQRSGEIESRSEGDLKSIRAQRNISELRARAHGKMLTDQNERGYYLRFDVGERLLSLSDRDREQREQDRSVFSFIEKVKTATALLSKKAGSSTRVGESDGLRERIVKKLDEHLAGIRKEVRSDQQKAKVLGNVLIANSANGHEDPSYSSEQIAEIEKLSVQLKLKGEYESNWKKQRSIIESAGSDSVEFRRRQKVDPTADLSAHKNQIIAGRALAKEVVAKVEFDKAKEDLKIFQESKRFQKFAVASSNSGSLSYLSLQDVDLPKRSSLLDRAVEELFEGSEHKALRRTVSALVTDKEQRLKNDVIAAKEIMVSASRNASEFKDFSYFGLKSETGYHPIFTSAEIAMLESRISKTDNPKEAMSLRTVLDSAADQSIHSLSDLLRDSETSKQTLSEVKEIESPSHDKSRVDRQERDTERSTILRRQDRSAEGLSR
jgi:hypothetical protein